jgi:hypothetical protein
MHHGMKTYGMELDIHDVSIPTVQDEWSASKNRCLQPNGKSRVYKMSRGPARLHRLSGCEKRDYWNLSPSVLSSIPQPTVTIMISDGSILPLCYSKLNCPQIAVYRDAWSSCFETSPPTPSHHTPQATNYANVSNTQIQHKNWQSIPEWPAKCATAYRIPGTVRHHAQFTSQIAISTKSERPLSGRRKSQKIKTGVVYVTVS